MGSHNFASTSICVHVFLNPSHGSKSEYQVDSNVIAKLSGFLEIVSISIIR